MNNKISIKKEKITTEKIFLYIVPIFCALLCLAMPMTKGHDESIHALRIYEYAEGKIFSNGKKAYLEEGIITSLNEKASYNDLFNSNNNYSINTKTVEYGYRISPSSPVNYLPQVIGVIIGRIFTDNSMIHLYIARLFNIVSTIIIIYFAIKKIPFGKNLLFLLSLIPITIEGMSTLSADGLTIATAFFWIAYVLNLAFSENKNKINMKNIITLTVTAIVLSLSKSVYVVLLPLIFIIPKEKWGSKKEKILMGILIIAIGFALDVYWYFNGITYNSATNGESNISLIFSNVLGYIGKIFYTIVLYFEKYMQEVFGGRLEWNENVKIMVFPYIILITSILLLTRNTKNSKEVKFKTSQKVIMTLCFLAGIGLIFTAMFTSWSKTNMPQIEGAQGRYFTPILPLIYLIVAKKFDDDIQTSRTIALIGLVMQIYVIMQLVLYHI